MYEFPTSITSQMRYPVGVCSTLAAGVSRETNSVPVIGYPNQLDHAAAPPPFSILSNFFFLS